MGDIFLRISSSNILSSLMSIHVQSEEILPMATPYESVFMLSGHMQQWVPWPINDNSRKETRTNKLDCPGYLRNYHTSYFSELSDCYRVITDNLVRKFLLPLGIPVRNRGIQVISMIMLLL